MAATSSTTTNKNPPTNSLKQNSNDLPDIGNFYDDDDDDFNNDDDFNHDNDIAHNTQQQEVATDKNEEEGAQQ